MTMTYQAVPVNQKADFEIPFHDGGIYNADGTFVKKANDLGRQGRGFNGAFIDKIKTSPEHEKQAGVSLTSFIRQKIREESFLENILTPQPITHDQLDKDVNLDRLRKIVEIEPESDAIAISFRGDPPHRYLKQDAAELEFYEIITDKVVKNTYELKTRDNDVRKIISDNHIKDMAGVQDLKWIEGCNAAVALNPAVQDQPFGGGLTKINFVEAMKMLPSLELENALVLCNNVTAKEFLKWDTTDIGYDPVTMHYKRGLTCGTVMGLKLLTTIKRDIVPDNVVYFFAPEDFLGKFFVLDDARVYIKTEGPFIEFYAYKSIAAGVLNARGVARATFNP